jgi:hexokinase
MFRRALAKQNLPITLTAVINDTTGTLIASRYVNPKTRIGVIFGTGCNAAYMEKVKNIPKIKKLGILNEDPEADVAINCEWGAFDSFNHQYLPRTKYDEQIDLQSNKPHEQAFEKLISGRYLGEIMRLILCELIDEGVLFLGQNTYKLEKPYSFDTAFLSLMETYAFSPRHRTMLILFPVTPRTNCSLSLASSRTSLVSRRRLRNANSSVPLPSLSVAEQLT